MAEPGAIEGSHLLWALAAMGHPVTATIHASDDHTRHVVRVHTWEATAPTFVEGVIDDAYLVGAAHPEELVAAMISMIISRLVPLDVVAGAEKVAQHHADGAPFDCELFGGVRDGTVFGWQASTGGEPVPLDWPPTCIEHDGARYARGFIDPATQRWRYLLVRP